jgi:hypothetical protein
LCSGSATLTFQDGVNGYSSTHDAYGDGGGTKNTNYGTAAVLYLASGDRESFLRFDNIFGASAGQIPTGVTITSATLKVNVTTPVASALANVYPVTASWNESALTWNNRPSAGSSSATFSLATTGLKEISVTTQLQSWLANPTSNYGWKFDSNQSATAELASSEAISSATRPLLEVSYHYTLQR